MVTLYLSPAVNSRLKPKLMKELKPGTRIVSHAFDLGDWKPQQKSDGQRPADLPLERDPAAPNRSKNTTVTPSPPSEIPLGLFVGFRT